MIGDLMYSYASDERLYIAIGDEASHDMPQFKIQTLELQCRSCRVSVDRRHAMPHIMIAYEEIK